MINKIDSKKKATFDIQGMHCAACAQTISKALNEHVGIDTANVNIASEKAYITYDSKKINKNEILKITKYLILSQ